MTPKVLVWTSRRMESWSCERGKLKIEQFWVKNVQFYRNTNFDVPVTHECKISSPCSLRPFSILVSAPGNWFMSISSVGSLWLLIMFSQWKAHRLEGGRRIRPWIYYPGFPCIIFHKFPVLPDWMLLLLSWKSHLHNSLLPIPSNCSFPSSSWPYGSFKIFKFFY